MRRALLLLTHTLLAAQSSAAAYGLYTWPSAPVLAQWAWMHRERLRGAAVLELGAGTALAGLVAASVGARVLLTDRADAQQARPSRIMPRSSRLSCAAQVLDNAEAAVARNGLGSSCSVAPLTWGDFSPRLVALPAQDVLLGADVLYDSAEFEPLLATVAFLLRRAPPGAAFVTAYQQRSRHASLEWRLEHWVRPCLRLDRMSHALSTPRCFRAWSASL